MNYNGCVMCESSDGQGCYSDCPTRLQARVTELEREVAWHKDNSARRGEAEAAVLRRVKALEEELSNYVCTCEDGYCAMQDGYRDHCGSTASALINSTTQEKTND